MQTAAFAGDGNTALIRQVGDNHTVQVSQTASNSDATVLQGGETLAAGVGQTVLRGAWALGDFWGASKNAFDAADNVAALVVRESFLAPSATGVGNDATVVISGDNSTANLFQTGNNNLGSVEVSGSDSKGTLWQHGNDNEAGLSVISDSTYVLYTQRGNGLKTSDGNTLTVYAPGNSLRVDQQ
ncbi:hypothetical protein GCM10007094_19350 [Pseudovibrio japonicus]|uniref:Uncharacterized protein n=2 Tax=Pseudovibrio japonicus TaxID=366534 RepID=A0ABQ3EDZ1_9HYPH|nr:hypothetical protein GCM10007094_19350 [Pseudovibrio japonicus]